MKKRKIAGLVAAFSVVVVAVANGILTPWPQTTGAQVVAEWYSDVPWHQKLSTYAGNQIDEPIMRRLWGNPRSGAESQWALDLPTITQVFCRVQKDVKWRVAVCAGLACERRRIFACSSQEKLLTTTIPRRRIFERRS